VLWVDDESSLIESMKRQLRNDFAITAAYSGDEGLKVVAANPPFAIIVSDQRMPGMDGIEFLSLVKDISPDSVRIMLTGFAEQETAINAVNQGQIFRFLTKPCPPHVVLRMLRDAARQYELITAEKEILEKTLTGSIEVLVDILALSNPVAFRHASRVGEYAATVAFAMSIKDAWQVKSAAMLLHLGYITLPAQVLESFYEGRHLSDSEEAMIQGQTENTVELLEKIPRLEPVVRIIRDYHTSRNTSIVKAKDLTALSANIVRACVDFDRIITRGMSRIETLRVFQSHPDEYNEEVVKALSMVKTESDAKSRVMVLVDSLANGMIVDEDVKTHDGMLIVPKGYVINDMVRRRLKNFLLHDDIEGSIAVKCE